MNTAHTFASPEVLCGGHYQLLVVVLQRHGWNHSLEAVLNEHQHSRREERGRDELVAQCLQSTHYEEAPPTWDSGHYTGDRIARWNGVLGVVPNAPTPLKKEGRKGGRIPSCFQDQTSGVEYECGMSTLRSCIAHTCYQVLIQHELKPYTGREMVSCNFYIYSLHHSDTVLTIMFPDMCAFCYCHA